MSGLVRDHPIVVGVGGAVSVLLAFGRYGGRPRGAPRLVGTVSVGGVTESSVARHPLHSLE